jgi:hypothetical protein
MAYTGQYNVDSFTCVLNALPAIFCRGDLQVCLCLVNVDVGALGVLLSMECFWKRSARTMKDRTSMLQQLLWT